MTSQMVLFSRSPLWRWLGLLAFITLVRVAGFFFGLVNLDECDFALFGRMVRLGAVPYLGVVDNKPPLTYFAYALAESLGGEAHWTFSIRVLGIIAVLLTSVSLFVAARAWTGSERAGWAAAWLSVAAGLCESPSVSAELLMNLPAAVALAGLAHADRQWRPRLDLIAGAAAATAMLFKQQAAILPLAATAALVWEALSMRRLPWSRVGARLICLAGGFAIPCLLMAAWLASLGGLRASFEWLVLRNFAQIGTSSSLFSPIRALSAIATCIVGATLLPWLLALRGAYPLRGVFHRTLVILLILTAVTVSLGGRYYEHYFLQFVPPLALLGASKLVALGDGWAGLRLAVRIAIVLLVVGPVVGYLAFTVGRGFTGGYPAQDPKTVAVASWLTQYTAPSDRLFVWGDQSMIYCSADRLPGTRYLRTAFHVGDVDPAHVDATSAAHTQLSATDVANTLADLEVRQPSIVVDTAAADIHHWSLFPLSVVPEIERYLEVHYRLETSVAGAGIYRRLSLAKTSPSPAVQPAP